MAELHSPHAFAAPPKSDGGDAGCTEVARPVGLPKGEMKPRRPPYSQIVTGVVRGKPVFLPRTVMSTSGPIGTPSLSRGLARRLKKGTQDGICRGSIGRSRGPGMVILMIVFEVLEAGGSDC